jgi:hypothetical protein
MQLGTECSLFLRECHIGICASSCQICNPVNGVGVVPLEILHLARNPVGDW